MRFYIAAKFENILNANKLAIELFNIGHVVISSWCLGSQEDLLSKVRLESVLSDDQKRGAAEKDIYDLKSSEAIVLLNKNFELHPDLEGVKVSGSCGRHNEFGYAIAAGLKCFVVGEHESIFHYLNTVTVVPSINDFVSMVKT